MDNQDYKEPYETLVERGLAEGVIGGVYAFTNQQRINLRPGRSSPVPLEDFFGLLTAEYVKDERYPYKDSFLDKIKEARGEAEIVLMALYNNDEIPNLTGLAHVIGGTVALEFLNANRIQTLKLIAEIRGE